DCTQYLSRLVLPYKPRLVVVYAGDNDLAEGRTPQQVMESFAGFVEGVHAQLPDTRIAYISIKPSPLRSALMDSAKETNALIARYSRSDPRLDYIDVHSRMLDAQGQPRAELFQADRLHMNEKGYALWKAVIAVHLKQVDAEAKSVAASPR
ncbi:MAG: GDSL-type esterase/lipase family protein, partial [Burkholderiaceae bacterium]